MIIAEKITQKRKFVGQSYEDNSIDDAAYEMKLIAAVKAGLAELDRGEFFTLEEVEKEIPSWIIR